MNKITNIIIGTILLFSFSSCENDQNDIFSKSAAERLNEVLANNNSLLMDAPNGWLMEYFATPYSPGYSLFVKFRASGIAYFEAKNQYTNNVIKSDTCTYGIIGDNGPVLTFNSYNTILHQFSTPENPNGWGLQGDYEFIIMNSTADKITMKGKKVGTVIILTKIPTDLKWSKYSSELDSINSILFGNNFTNMNLDVAGVNYIASNGSSHIFSLTKETTVDAPFIITRTGIRFYSPLEVEGKTIQTFTLNDEKSALVSIDYPDVKLYRDNDIAKYLVSNINKWVFDPNNMGSKVNVLYNQIVQSCKAKYSGATNVSVGFNYLNTRKSFEFFITFNVGKDVYVGNLDISLTTNSSNTVTIINKNTADFVGNAYSKSMSGYKELLDLISTDFYISTNQLINPVNINFSNSSDTEKSFRIIRQ